MYFKSLKFIKLSKEVLKIIYLLNLRCENHFKKI